MEPATAVVKSAGRVLKENMEKFAFFRTRSAPPPQAFPGFVRFPEITMVKQVHAEAPRWVAVPVSGTRRYLRVVRQNRVEKGKSATTILSSRMAGQVRGVG
jgi:hypothetical protein